MCKANLSPRAIFQAVESLSASRPAHTPPARMSLADSPSDNPWSPVARPSVADYEAIYEAVMATERGRWFLSEHARRHRHSDTAVVVAAIDRLMAAAEIEAQARASAALAASAKRCPDPERLRRELADLAGVIVRSRVGAPEPAAGDGNLSANETLGPLDALMRSNERTTANILAAAAGIQDLAWTMRARDADAHRCDLLDGHVAAIHAACADGAPLRVHMRRQMHVQRYVEARIQALIALWDANEGPDHGKTGNGAAELLALPAPAARDTHDAATPRFGSSPDNKPKPPRPKPPDSPSPPVREPKEPKPVNEPHNPPAEPPPIEEPDRPLAPPPPVKEPGNPSAAPPPGDEPTGSPDWSLPGGRPEVRVISWQEAGTAPEPPAHRDRAIAALRALAETMARNPVAAADADSSVPTIAEAPERSIVESRAPVSGAQEPPEPLRHQPSSAATRAEDNSPAEENRAKVANSPESASPTDEANPGKDVSPTKEANPIAEASPTKEATFTAEISPNGMDSSCPRSSRASTPQTSCELKDVDGRDKPGHDDWDGSTTTQVGTSPTAETNPSAVEVPDHGSREKPLGAPAPAPPHMGTDIAAELFADVMALSEAERIALFS
jgi:hypothetical protein